MNLSRREIIAALGGTGLTAFGAWVGLTRPFSDDGFEPVKIDTLEASGSQPGTMTVPVEGEVTVVDIFSTTCAPCVDQMDSLGAVESRLGDEAVFVSVTNQLVGEELSVTRDDIRDWWNRNGGDWTVGFDDDGKLTRAVSATGMPYLVIVDTDGEVAWSHAGVVGEEKLTREIRDVLDGG
ncbi:MAG: TlpA disulfide reductase family protein [Halobacteria archaeon]|nr:TlpA disulfide reductase family protein [Halobacteria archaeon]